MSKKNIVIIGASGELGSAFVRLYASDGNNIVHAYSRSSTHFQQSNIVTGAIDFYDESSLKIAADQCSEKAPIDTVIVATGLLHDEKQMPEKSLRELSRGNMEKIFLANTIGPALTAKYFIPKMQNKKKSVFAVLSARVGSITDNRIGGWYSYRASKAAVNMMIKTISIESSRRFKHSIVVGLHPGTVDSKLSQPFQQNVPKGKLFSADYSVKKLAYIIQQLSPSDSGKLFAWDGTVIPY